MDRPITRSSEGAKNQEIICISLKARWEEKIPEKLIIKGNFFAVGSSEYTDIPAFWDLDTSNTSDVKKFLQQGAGEVETLEFFCKKALILF